MEFSLGGFNAVYSSPSASSSIYTNLSDQASEEGIWRRSVSVGGRLESLRELEKKMIREEMLTEYTERRRVLEAEVRRELMIEREMVSMQSRRGYESYDTTSFMVGPPHIYHKVFHQGVLLGETGGLEAVVPLQRRPRSPEIMNVTAVLPKVGGKKATIDLGRPYVPTPVKRKRRPPPSPAVGGSSEVCYRSKKKGNEWSCALCKVSATCELDLEEHLAGKKHQAKAAGLRADKKVIRSNEKGKRILKKASEKWQKSRGKSCAR